MTFSSYCGCTLGRWIGYDLRPDHSGTKVVPACEDDLDDVLQQEHDIANRQSGVLESGCLFASE